jgi:carbamoyl-phosphate synthase small subunit
MSDTKTISKSVLPRKTNAALVLSDGEVFYGYGIGAPGQTMGEICFNTSMTGYQEVLTDPSYTGQIIIFTFPHVGNVGTNEEDYESNKPHASGLIIRENITSPSNFRNTEHLNTWLSQNGITGICGLDTREITRRVRIKGPQNVAICYPEEGQEIPLEEIKEALKAHPNLDGLELAKTVTTSSSYEWKERRWKLGEGYRAQEEFMYHVVAIDYGEKRNILRCLVEESCKVTVVSASTPADEILALKPDGVFLSNGPGDPAATAEYAVPIIKQLLKALVPIFGICLGHQLLALALGASTEKMFQGHRGANHPVKDNQTGKVEITSQNHGFVVSHADIPENVEITHLSLFDGTIEGLRVLDKPAFCVQHHPESSPGPHDSRYLFAQFTRMMRDHAKA